MIKKDRKSARVALVAAMVAASAWAGQGMALASTASTPTASEASIAANVLSLLNSERAANGLPALRASAALALSARTHNTRMAQANVMSHQLPGEAALGARVTQVGVSWHNVAENIGWTTDRTVNGARGMQVMMYQEKAPNDGHRRNILSPSVSYVGIDVLIDPGTGKLWLTEDLADATGATATATSRPAPAASHNPVGHVDRVTVLPGNKVRLTGWALDPDNRAQPLAIAVYYDGKGVGWTRRPVARPDVSRAKAAGPNQGFDVTVTLPAGAHTVSVYAINIGAGTGNPRIGAKAVTLGAAPTSAASHNPTGHLDSVTARAGHQVRITGWAVDPDNRAQPLAIAVYYDGKGLGWIRQPAARPDVSRAKAAGPNQGFDVTVTLPAGAHTVSVYAINIGAGTGNPRIGAKAVRV